MCWFVMLKHRDIFDYDSIFTIHAEESMPSSPDMSSMRDQSKYISKMVIGICLLYQLIVLAIPVFSSHRRIFHSMHEIYTDTSVKTYWNFDWLMSIDPLYKDTKYIASTSSCRNGDEYCSPNYWHLQTACPLPGETFAAYSARVKTVNGSVVANHAAFTPENYDDMKNGVGGQFFTGDFLSGAALEAPSVNALGVLDGFKFEYGNKIMYDACVLSRIPKVYKVHNDVNAYGLTGAHDSNLLLWFAALIVFNFGLYSYSMNSPKDQTNSYYDYSKIFRYFNMGLVFVLIILFFIDTSGSELNYKSKGSEVENVFKVTAAKGTWFYGVIYSILSMYFLFYGKLSEHDEKSDEILAQNSTSANLGYKIAAQSESRMPQDGSTMNVSGFFGKQTPTFDAGLFKADGPKIAPEEVKWSNLNSDTIGVSYFAALQFCTLPIWLLSIYTHCRNYDSDIEVQVVYLAAALYCSIDLIENRVSQAFRCMLLVHKSDSYVNAIRCSALLSVVVQFSLFMVLFYTVPWNWYDNNMIFEPVATADSYMRAGKWIAVICWVSYFVLSGLVKIYNGFMVRIFRIYDMSALTILYLFIFILYSTIITTMTIVEYSTDARIGNVFSEENKLMSMQNDHHANIRLKWQSGMRQMFPN